MANSSQFVSTAAGRLGLLGKGRARPSQSRPGRIGQTSLSPWLGIATVCAAAILLGILIAQERWLYVGLLAALLLALQWPIEVALGSYVFLLPFEFIATLGHSSAIMTVNRLLGAVAAVAIIVTGTVRKRLAWPPRAAMWWLLFLIWALLTITWALQPQASLRWLPTVIPLVSLYLVAVCWRLTPKEMDTLTWLMLAGGFLAACFTVYQYLNGITYATWVQTGRATLAAGSQEADPNILGTDLLLPFALAVGWFLSATSRLQTILGICVVGCLGYATFLTMSRGSMIAMAVVVGIFVLRVGWKRRVMVIGSALLLLLLAMPSSFFSRLQTAVSSGGAGRVEIWQVGLTLVKRYWLTGAGLVNFPVAYTEYAGQASRFVGYGRGAHNLYLSAAVDFGIVGLLVMIAAAVSHLRSLRRLRTGTAGIQALAFEAACWAMLVAGVFEDITWLKSFWLAWMLALMVLRVQSNLAEETSPRTAEAPTLTTYISSGFKGETDY